VGLDRVKAGSGGSEDGGGPGGAHGSGGKGHVKGLLIESSDEWDPYARGVRYQRRTSHSLGWLSALAASYLAMMVAPMLCDFEPPADPDAVVSHDVIDELR
jgi:hypothetical protein